MLYHGCKICIILAQVWLYFSFNLWIANIIGSFICLSYCFPFCHLIMSLIHCLHGLVAGKHYIYLTYFLQSACASHSLLLIGPNSQPVFPVCFLRHPRCCHSPNHCPFCLGSFKPWQPCVSSWRCSRRLCASVRWRFTACFIFNIGR